jgi:hypothetical protein
MSGAGAARNLLLGIIALQMDFISRDALIAAMHAWVLNKATPLSRVLLDQGALNESRRALQPRDVADHHCSGAGAGGPVATRDELASTARIAYFGASAKREVAEAILRRPLPKRISDENGHRAVIGCAKQWWERIANTLDANEKPPACSRANGNIARGLSFIGRTGRFRPGADTATNGGSVPSKPGPF